MSQASSALRFVPVTSAPEIASVAELAREIWYEYYPPLIGRAQVDYMVSKFQSPQAIARQLEEGYEYFLIHRDGRPAGYFAVLAKREEQSLFLSKLYVLQCDRGSGTGRQALGFIEQLARDRGLKLLWLTVNKGNPAVKAYERLGFRIAADLVMDIGGGFVMDDFRMEKSLG